MVPYFFGFPGLEHLVLHSLVVKVVNEYGQGQTSPSVGGFANHAKRSSAVKHIEFISPSISVAETRFLLHLPRALEIFVLKAAVLGKNAGKTPMLLRDWRNALLAHRSTLNFLAMLPVCKRDPALSGFCGSWYGTCDADGNQIEDDTRPVNDRLGSLCEFQVLGTLMVSIVFLFGFRVYEAPGERIGCG